MNPVTSFIGKLSASLLLKIVSAVVFSGILALAGYGVYRHFVPKKVEIIRTIEIQTPKVVVKKVPVIKKKIEYIRVYDKQELEKTTDIPKEIKKDKDKEVVTVGEVETKKGKDQILAVTDINTGETSLLRQEVKENFRWEGGFSPYAEVKAFGTHNAPLVRAGVQIDIARVKRDFVVYAKAEGGIIPQDDFRFNNNSIVQEVRKLQPYAAVYGGIKWEYNLFGK